MKTLVMTLVAGGTLAAAALSADAQDYRRSGFRHGWGYELGRERPCPPAPVPTTTVIIGYEDVWIDQPYIIYETRTVYRPVIVGYDHCGRPIYRQLPSCEQVPVVRTRKVCEKRPIYGPRPVHSGFSWGVRFSFGR